MRALEFVDEFRREAANALLTRQQAMAITLQLLTRELKEGENTPEEVEQLEKAIQKIDLRYLDATATQTDLLLDSFNVARFTTEDVLKAIDNIMFDVA